MAAKPSRHHPTAVARLAPASAAVIRRLAGVSAYVLGRGSRSLVTESASDGSKLLLVGGLALVVLVVAETTLLALLGPRLGLALGLRRRYGDAARRVRRASTG